MQTTPKLTEHSTTRFSARLFGISSRDVREAWPAAKVLLLPAISRSLGRYDEASVLKGILDKDMQLWMAVAEVPLAAAVTQINVWPTGLRTCRMILAGGKEMERWVHMMDHVAEWAKSMDCRYLEIGGRDGWQRVFGWRKTAIELVKDLTDA